VDLGIVPVFAAGNDGHLGPGSIDDMTSYQKNIVVGANEIDHKIADFSSIGPGSFLGLGTQKPDLTTPGHRIISTYNNNQYAWMSGTSMAAPHVTATIALILEANPALTVEQIRNILINSTADMGMPGWDVQYGHGNLDAFRAVGLALNRPKWNQTPLISHPDTDILSFSSTLYTNPDAGNLKSFSLSVNGEKKYEEELSGRLKNINIELHRQRNFIKPPDNLIMVDKLGEGDIVYTIEAHADNGTDFIWTDTWYY
ncbi:MAG: S8 family peptidase, partial [Candidatus Muiribacteriota bacterium]